MKDPALKNASVKELKQHRDDEIDKLRARMEKITDTLQTIEQEPGRWVGEHPWSATLGAAAAGFLAGHFIPSGSGKKKRGRPRIDWEDDEPPARSAFGGRGDMIGIVMGLFEQVMPLVQATILSGKRGPNGATPVSDDGIYYGDAGTTQGEKFPGFCKKSVA